MLAFSCTQLLRDAISEVFGRISSPSSGSLSKVSLGFSSFSFLDIEGTIAVE